MLERQYDPSQPYRFLRYGRMSDPRQNKRSPEQQFATIDETIQRGGFPWRCVASYRDDGISGRYLRKRAGFQRMLRDIEAGLIRVDLIVVDTLERLGRSDEIAELRRKLFVEYGVLIVAADNHFADPTGVVGKAVGMVEQIRSTENTRVSRHNVIRGKKDAARLGRWPGGPPPFGYRLKPVIDNASAPPAVYNVLEPDPRQAAAQRLLFQRADATGEGDTRLARWWNNSPRIPSDFKPVSPYTIGYRLENPIAIGTLRWGENRTAIVNDTRVIERNPDGGERIPNFCSPIISVERYDRVQKLRQARAKDIQRGRRNGDEGDGKLIAPQAPGLTLKYLLTGLLRCGCCNASLRPLPSGRRSSTGRRYVYYSCPRRWDGACSNHCSPPEDRLRKAVIARVRELLFPIPREGQPPTWLSELFPMIRQEQERYRAQEPDDAAANREELQGFEKQLAGWSMTLGNPQLPAAVRSDIERRYAAGKQRLGELQATLLVRKQLEENHAPNLNIKQVLDALQRLDAVLVGHNPTVGNLELSKHVDVITCHADGRIELRGTALGIFEGAVTLLCPGKNEQLASNDGSGFASVIPRARGRLHVSTLSALVHGPAAGHRAHEPNGATHLPPEFSWTESLPINETSCWSNVHALEVARLRETGKTHEQLAAHFHVSVPTIRKALKIAREADPSLHAPRKMPRRCWAKDRAAEVACLKAEGLSISEIGRKLGKSEPTIRAALEYAQNSKNGT